MVATPEYFPNFSQTTRSANLAPSVAPMSYARKDSVGRTIIDAGFIGDVKFNTRMVGGDRTKWSVQNADYADYFARLTLPKSEHFDDFCDHFTNKKTHVKACFNTTSRTYHWGPKKTVSDYKSCARNGACNIDSDKQVEAEWIYPTPNMLPIFEWEKFVHPGVKDALPINDKASSDPVNMRFFGPGEARIWFKPLYVNITGQLKLERVENSENDVYYNKKNSILVPIANADNVLQGLYGLENKH